jgi:AcrR family transcriptional regulator
MTSTRRNLKHRGVRAPASRRRLVDAAIASIVEIGYARTSVAEVVARAGMTKGAHVYYFSSKLDLMRLTVEHLFGQVQRRMAESIAGPPRTLRDVENALQAAAAVALDQEGVALYEVWMASRTDAALRRVFRRLEADSEAMRQEILVSTFGPALAVDNRLRMAMHGVTLIVRGLALQQILRHDAANSPEWLYWRKHMAREIFGALPRRRRRA